MDVPINLHDFTFASRESFTDQLSPEWIRRYDRKIGVTKGSRL